MRSINTISSHPSCFPKREHSTFLPAYCFQRQRSFTLQPAEGRQLPSRGALPRSPGYAPHIRLSNHLHIPFYHGNIGTTAQSAPTPKHQNLPRRPGFRRGNHRPWRPSPYGRGARVIPPKRTKKRPHFCGRFYRINYSMTLMTTPEPTVRPPSRIAKRRPSSMAMGLIRVISMSTLSPGMTISTPSGSLMSPVMSVVRK